MKMVYLAEDMRLASRPCALAEMARQLLTDPTMQQQAVAAFQREADMLAQPLSNEHIPRVFDRFSDQNHHYLVMEFIDGITLEDELKANDGKLDADRVIDIALQVLDTLQYLHNLEPPVVYRDLKPSNVMLGRNGQVKLIDFGIARFFLPQSNATMIGNPRLCASRAVSRPRRNRAPICMRSAPPCITRCRGVIRPRSRHSVFPKLRTLCPDLNPSLADLVDQALEYDLVHRMADAAEFKERLLAIKAGATTATAKVNRADNFAAACRASRNCACRWEAAPAPDDLRASKMPPSFCAATIPALPVVPGERFQVILATAHFCGAAVTPECDLQWRFGFWMRLP